jgi:hypothetical protein
MTLLASNLRLEATVSVTAEESVSKLLGGEKPAEAG